KAAVSAMPVVSVKARARITAIFMAITPLQRCLELFEVGATLWGRLIKNGQDAKQTIAIAVKYPMRSAAIVISSITHPPVWRDAARTGEKLCPTSQQIGGEIELFPAPREAHNLTTAQHQAPCWERPALTTTQRLRARGKRFRLQRQILISSAS